MKKYLVILVVLANLVFQANAQDEVPRSPLGYGAYRSG